MVEPFTGEGIYYALRSGELAANAVAKIVRGDESELSVARISLALTPEMYRGRLWINRLARAAVLRPQLGSLFVHAARIRPEIIEASDREDR